MRKKLFIAIFAVVLVFAVVSLIGAFTTSHNPRVASTPTPVAPPNVPATTEESNTQAVGYPGNIGYDLPWVQTIKDGYKLGLDVTVWEPIKLEKAYSHPVSKQLVMEPHKGYVSGK